MYYYYDNIGTDILDSVMLPLKVEQMFVLSNLFVFLSFPLFPQDGPVNLMKTKLPDVVFSCYMIFYPLVTINLILNCFADAPPVLKRKAIPKDEVNFINS